MITAFLFYFLKRLFCRRQQNIRCIQSGWTQVPKGLLVVALLIVLPTDLCSQCRNVEYTISRKGDEVGFMSVTISTHPGKTILSLTSEVEIRAVMRMLAKGTEEVVFEHGSMIRSSYLRTLNGKEKENKHTQRRGSGYWIVQNGSTYPVAVSPITCHMLNLYISEPTGFQEVYSDKHECLLPIEKVDPGHYRLRFPDGNSNDYFYEDGICMRIEVHHKLYSVVIERKSDS